MVNNLWKSVHTTFNLATISRRAAKANS